MKRINLRKDLDQLSLLELFWVEPSILKPKEGYSCYEVIDESGVGLKFGVDTIQESVQLEVKVSDINIVTLSFELVEFLDIIDEEKGQFQFLVSPSAEHTDTKVEVQLRPKIKILGATLEK
jgi:hypothetical protein